MRRTIEERNKLVEDHLKLVYYVCKKMWNWAKGKGFGGEFGDLVSIGSLAIIRAAENYEEEGRARFSTFAHKYIQNAIITEARKAGLIRVPIDSEERYYEICKRKNRLDKYYEMKEAKKVAYGIVSLSAIPIGSSGEDDEYVVAPKQLIAPEQPDPVINSELRELVNTKLKDSFRKVIVNHFWDNKSLQTIANEMGLCRPEISRKKKMALKQLRQCYGVG